MSSVLVYFFFDNLDVVFEGVHLLAEVFDVVVEAEVVGLCFDEFVNKVIDVVEVGGVLDAVEGLLVLLDLGHAQVDVGCISSYVPPRLGYLLF